MLIIALIVQGFRDPTEEKKPRIRPDLTAVIPPVRNKKPKKTSGTESIDQSDAPKGYQLVADETALWVPPFAAETPPVSLKLLPPGPGMIVSTRLADLSSDPNNQRLVSALSPEITALIQLAISRAKVPLESIERCTIAFHTGSSGTPTTSLVIDLTEPMPLETLAKKWNSRSFLTKDGATIYASDDPDADVFYLGDSDKGKLPSTASVKSFAVGSVKLITEVAVNEGGPIPLPRFAENLWKESSTSSDLVVLALPNFLFADARNLLLKGAPELEAPLKQTLQGSVAAIMLSAESADDLVYAEMRAIPSGNITVPQLLNTLRQSIQAWPSWAELFNADYSPDPSWKLLAGRLPSMFRFLINHTRFGATSDAVIANAYVPGNAATQISLGTLLAMNTKPGAGGAVTSSAGASKPLTIEQILNQKISIEFGKETLEDTIALISDELKNGLPANTKSPPIRLVLSEMRKDGITQNQSIVDFKKSGIPIRQVLTDVVRAVNPDPEATGSNDPRQVLIWIIGKTASGETEIQVTTRGGAAGKELPTEFKLAE